VGRSGWGKKEGKRLKEKGMNRRSRKNRKNEKHLSLTKTRKKSERLAKTRKF